MKKIDDIAQLSTLLSAYFKKEILTNNYTMLEDYRKYIQNDELFFEKTEAGILLLHNCKSHWQVFYYLKDVSIDLPFPQDKPSVMEIIFKTNDSKHQLALSYWETRGFKPYIYRKHMSTSSIKLTVDNTAQESVDFAKSHHALSIHDLISKTFDVYLGCIPSLPEVMEAITKKEFFCIEDSEGYLNGVLHIGQKRNTYFILHLVVAPRSRNKGIAKRILAYFDTRISKHERTKIQLWVKEDNLSAQHLYENAGFQYDGWKSVGLLHHPKNINY